MARAEIRKMAAMGIKFTGEIALTPMPGPTAQEIEILQGHRRRSEEGRRHGAGPCRELARDDGRRRRRRAAAGPPPQQRLGDARRTRRRSPPPAHKVLGTIGFGAPVFGVFADDNKPALPRRQAVARIGIVDGVRLGEEAGYMPVNARTHLGCRRDRSATAPTRPTTRSPASSTS